MIGIYKITSPTNKIYIGSSKDINNRLCKYKNLKCKTQSKLYNSLKKYGYENHVIEIIEECTLENLLKRELYYGLKFNVLDKNLGLNCRLPKIEDGYYVMSSETRKKIGTANKIKQTGKIHNYYKSSLKKLEINQVLEIKKLLVENKLTQKEISILFNVSRKTISNINTNKTYKYLKNDVNLNNSKKMYIKLTNIEYDKIFEMIEENKTQKFIANFFGVHQSHISRIINKSNYIKSYKRKECQEELSITTSTE